MKIRWTKKYPLKIGTTQLDGISSPNESWGQDSWWGVSGWKVLCARRPGKRHISGLPMNVPGSYYFTLGSVLLYYQVRSFSYAFTSAARKMVQAPITVITVFIITQVSRRPARSSDTLCISVCECLLCILFTSPTLMERHWVRITVLAHVQMWVLRI